MKKLFAFALALLSPAAFAATVSIYVAVSPRVAAQGGNDVAAIANAQIRNLNATLAASGVTNLTVTLAGFQVPTFGNYDNWTVVQSALFVNYPLYTARDASGADMLAIIIDSGSSTNGRGFAAAILPTDAKQAIFAAQLDGLDHPHYTFEHEFGHLLGARHPDDYAASPYTYGRGYWATALAGSHQYGNQCVAFCFRDIMTGSAGFCYAGTATSLGIYSTPHKFGNYSQTYTNSCEVAYGTTGSNATLAVSTSGPAASMWSNQKIGKKTIAGAYIAQIISLLPD